MAVLRIVAIKCDKQDDYWGDDNVYIFVNGKRLWGPTFMDGDGRFVPVNRDFVFKRTARIELFDQDANYDNGGGDDDRLGILTVSASDVGEHRVMDEFTRPREWSYTLVYEVIETPRRTAAEIRALV